MTTIARTFSSIPQRSALETWRAVVELLAPHASVARRELEGVSGIAAALIASEAMTSSIVIWGAGPRVRVYCLYGEDAIGGDSANESPLSFTPTDGDWRMSLPAAIEDLNWVVEALASKSNRVSARQMDDVSGATLEAQTAQSTRSQVLVVPDIDAFMRR